MKSFVHDSLTFEVDDDGPTEGRVVILLHGFPEDRHCWDGVAKGLVAQGYRVIAPDQRGYSPGARPEGRRSYTVDKLSGDILALADVAGAERFDVVGHDWGALVAWDLAGRHPDRVRTLTSLSIPHPRAVQAAMLHSRQALHSWYIAAFQVPKMPELVLRLASGRGAAELEKDGLDAESARRYARRFAQRGAMTGPINWYRALPLSARDRLPDVSVPTLLVWSDGDRYVTRYGAEHTHRYVTGPYRFEALHGVPHWIPSVAADEVTPMIIEHLASVGA